MEKFVKQELNILYELLHHTHTEEITDPEPDNKTKKVKHTGPRGRHYYIKNIYNKIKHGFIKRFSK